MWREYLPAEFRRYAPTMESFLERPSETMPERLERLGEYALLPTPKVMCVEGRPLLRDVSEEAYIETGLSGESRRAYLELAETTAGQLESMNASGVEAAMLLPTFAPFLIYDDEAPAARSRAYADAYNRWLSEVCKRAPTRLFGAALLSRHEPELLVADVERWADAGLSAVVMRPNPVGGRTVSDPSLNRFWSACAHHQVTVLLHEGTHTRVVTAGADRFRSHFGQHACSHPIEMMMALLSLIEGGVLHAHPSLRVGLLEAGCGWLPYWLWRLDHVEYAQLRGEVRGRVEMPPSEYFARQCWIAFEPNEALLPAVMKEIGPARFVFGSDFPHLDHGLGIVDEARQLEGSVGCSTLGSVMWENALRLLGPRVENAGTGPVEGAKDR